MIEAVIEMSFFTNYYYSKKPFGILTVMALQEGTAICWYSAEDKSCDKNAVHYFLN